MRNASRKMDGARAFGLGVHLDEVDPHDLQRLLLRRLEQRLGPGVVPDDLGLADVAGPTRLRRRAHRQSPSSSRSPRHLGMAHLAHDTASRRTSATAGPGGETMKMIAGPSKPAAVSVGSRTASASQGCAPRPARILHDRHRGRGVRAMHQEPALDVPRRALAIVDRRTDPGRASGPSHGPPRRPRHARSGTALPCSGPASSGSDPARRRHRGGGQPGTMVHSILPRRRRRSPRRAARTRPDRPALSHHRPRP